MLLCGKLYTECISIHSELWGCYHFSGAAQTVALNRTFIFVNKHPFRLWAEQMSSSGRSVLRGTGPAAPYPRLQAPPDQGDRYGPGSGSGSGREGVLLAGTLGLSAQLPAAGRGGRARGHSWWTLLDPVSEEVLLPFQKTEDAAAALGVTAAGRSPQCTGPGAGSSSHTQESAELLNWGRRGFLS